MGDGEQTVAGRGLQRIEALYRLGGLDEVEALAVLRSWLLQPRVAERLTPGVDGAWPGAAQLLSGGRASAGTDCAPISRPEEAAQSESWPETAPAVSGPAVAWLLLELLLSETLGAAGRTWQALDVLLLRLRRRCLSERRREPVASLTDLVRELAGTEQLSLAELLSRLSLVEEVAALRRGGTGLQRLCEQLQPGNAGGVMVLLHNLLESPPAVAELWFSPQEGRPASLFLQRRPLRMFVTLLLHGLLLFGIVMVLLLGAWPWQSDRWVRQAWVYLSHTPSPQSSARLVLITDWEGHGQYSSPADLARLRQVAATVLAARPRVLGVDVILPESSPAWPGPLADLRRQAQEYGVELVLMRSSRSAPEVDTDTAPPPAAPVPDDSPALLHYATDELARNWQTNLANAGYYLVRSPQHGLDSLALTMVRWGLPPEASLAKKRLARLPNVINVPFWKPAAVARADPSWLRTHVVFDYDLLAPTEQPLPAGANTPDWASVLRGQHVILGVDTPLQDRHPSPFDYLHSPDRQVPGALLHLFALEALLPGQTGGRSSYNLELAPYWPWFIVGCWLLTVLHWRCVPFFLPNWPLLALPAAFLAGWALFAGAGVMSTWLAPATVFVLSYPVLMILATVMRERQVRKLWQAGS